MTESTTDLIKTALSGATDSATGNCTAPSQLDPVLLAEYLDGVLEGQELALVEQHLASCTFCRNWASEAGLAIAAGEEKKWSPRSRSWRRSLAIAATLAGLTLGLLAWMYAPPTAPASGDLKVELDDLPYFDEFLDHERRPVLRGDNAHGPQPVSPQPVSPRWSTIRDGRPVFRWYGGVANRPLRGEILLVDDGEQIVATFPLVFDTTAGDTAAGDTAAGDTSAGDTSAGMQQFSWPDEQPPLASDRTYAWKINWLVDDEWVASHYVPLHVLPAVDVARQLQGLAADDLRGVVAMANLGLHDEALARLAHLASQPVDQNLVDRLVKMILQRKHFSPDLLAREYERWRTESRQLDPRR